MTKNELLQKVQDVIDAQAAMKGFAKQPVPIWTLWEKKTNTLPRKN